jgi:hypothetical protein
MSQRISYLGSALPGNAETVVLFSTALTAPGPMENMLQKRDIRRIFLSLTNDQAGTLNAYQSVDRGTTWRKVYTTGVGASPLNGENQYDLYVEPYADWKLEWVNGATPQTVFIPNMVATDERVVAV